MVILISGSKVMNFNLQMMFVCVYVWLQEKVSVSVVSPRDRPSLRAIFELGLQTDEPDSKAFEAADHALRQGHLALLQIQVPGREMVVFVFEGTLPSYPGVLILFYN